MDCGLPRKAVDSRRAIVTDLQMTLAVEEKIFRLNVAMSYTLAVQICNTAEDLLEAAFDLGARHSSLLDGSVQIATRAILHDFAPVLIFVLNEVHSLDDVHVMQSRGNAELGCKFLYVFFLSLVLSPLAEFLDGIQFLLSSIPFVSQADDGRSSFANRHSATHSVLLQQTRRAFRCANA